MDGNVAAALILVAAGGIGWLIRRRIERKDRAEAAGEKDWLNLPDPSPAPRPRQDPPLIVPQQLENLTLLTPTEHKALDKADVKPVKSGPMWDRVKHDQSKVYLRDILPSPAPYKPKPRSALPVLTIKDLIEAWDSAPAGAQLRQNHIDQAVGRDLRFEGDLRSTHEEAGELTVTVTCQLVGRVFVVTANARMSEEFSGIERMRVGTPVSGIGRVTWIEFKHVVLNDSELKVG